MDLSWFVWEYGTPSTLLIHGLKLKVQNWMFPIIQWASLADVQKHPNQIVSYCIPLFTNIYISYQYIYIVILSLKWSDPHDFAWNPASFRGIRVSSSWKTPSCHRSAAGTGSAASAGRALRSWRDPSISICRRWDRRPGGGETRMVFFWVFLGNLGRIKLGIWWRYNE